MGASQSQEADATTRGGAEEILGGAWENFAYGGALGAADDELYLRLTDRPVLSEAREKLVDRLVDNVKTSMGYKIKGDHDRGEVIKAILRELPKGSQAEGNKTYSTNSKHQKETCKKLAKAVNKAYNKKIIDPDASPSEVCSQVHEVVSSLGHGAHHEYLRISDDVRRIAQNLELLTKMLSANRGKLSAMLQSCDSSTVRKDAELVEDAYNVLINEFDRQKAVLLNLLHAQIEPLDEDISKYLRKSKDLRGMVEKLKGKLGSTELSDKLAYVLQGFATNAAIANQTKQAMDKMGMSVSEFKNIRSIPELQAEVVRRVGKAHSGKELYNLMKAVAVLKKHMHKKADLEPLLGGSTEEGLDQFMSWLDGLEANSGEWDWYNSVFDHAKALGVEGAGEDGDVCDAFEGVVGGAKSYKQFAFNKELTVGKKARDMLKNDFKTIIPRHFQRFASAVEDYARSMPVAASVDDDTRRFVNVLEQMEDIDERVASAHLLSTKGTDNDRYYRRQFGERLTAIANTARAAGATGVASAAEDVLSILDTYADAIASTNHNMVKDTAGSGDPGFFGGAGKKGKKSKKGKKTRGGDEDGEDGESGDVADPVAEEEEAKKKEQEAMEAEVADEDLVEESGGCLTCGGAESINTSDIYVPEEITGGAPKKNVRYTEASTRVAGFMDRVKKAIGAMRNKVRVAALRKSFHNIGKDAERYNKDYTELLARSIADKIKRIDAWADALRKSAIVNVGGTGYSLNDSDTSITPLKGRNDGALKDIREHITNMGQARADLYRALESLDLYLRNFNDGAVKSFDNVKDLISTLETLQLIDRWYSAEACKDVYRQLDILVGRSLNTAIKWEDFSNDTTGAVAQVTKFFQNFSALKNLLAMFGGLCDKYEGDNSKDVPMSLANINRAFVNFVTYCFVHPFAHDVVATNDAGDTVEGGAIQEISRDVISKYSAGGPKGQLDYYLAEDFHYLKMALRAIAAKILTCVGLAEAKNERNPPRSTILTPYRVAIGGAGHANVVDANIEFYIRMVLMAKFFNELFNEFDDKKTKSYISGREDKDVRLALIPEFDNKWRPFAEAVFIRYKNSSSYNNTSTGVIVEALNYAKAQCGNATVPEMVSDFISEVNKRYGLVRGESLDEYLKEKRDQYFVGAANVKSTGVAEDADYPLLDGEATEDVRKFHPSDRYTGNITMGRSADAKDAYNRFRLRTDQANIFTDIHRHMNKMFTDFGESKMSLRETVRNIAKDVARAPNAGARLGAIVKALNSLENFSQDSNDRFVAIHETVVQNLAVLTAATTHYAKFVTNVARMWSATSLYNDVSLEDDLTTQKSNIDKIKTVFKLTDHVHSVNHSDNINEGDLLGDYGDYSSTSVILNTHKRGDLQHAMALRYCFRLDRVFKDLCETVFHYSGDNSGLISVQVHKGGFIIDDSRMREVLKNLYEDCVYFLNKFVGRVDSKTIQAYSDCIKTVEKTLINRLFGTQIEGRQQKGDLETVKELADEAMVTLLKATTMTVDTSTTNIVSETDNLIKHANWVVQQRGVCPQTLLLYASLLAKPSVTTEAPSNETLGQAFPNVTDEDVAPLVAAASIPSYNRITSAGGRLVVFFTYLLTIGARHAKDSNIVKALDTKGTIKGYVLNAGDNIMSTYATPSTPVKPCNWSYDKAISEMIFYSRRFSEKKVVDVVSEYAGDGIGDLFVSEVMKDDGKTKTLLDPMFSRRWRLYDLERCLPSPSLLFNYNDAIAKLTRAAYCRHEKKLLAPAFASLANGVKANAVLNGHSFPDVCVDMRLVQLIAMLQVGELMKAGVGPVDIRGAYQNSPEIAPSVKRVLDKVVDVVNSNTTLLGNKAKPGPTYGADKSGIRGVLLLNYGNTYDSYFDVKNGGQAASKMVSLLRTFVPEDSWGKTYMGEPVEDASTFASLSFALRNAFHRKDKKGEKHVHLYESASEVPVTSREELLVNLPAVSRYLKAIDGRCQYVKSILETLNSVDRLDKWVCFDELPGAAKINMTNLTVEGGGINVVAPVQDVHAGTRYHMQMPSEDRYAYLNALLTDISEGISAVQHDVQSVMRDFADSTRLFETSSPSVSALKGTTPRFVLGSNFSTMLCEDSNVQSIMFGTTVSGTGPYKLGYGIRGAFLRDDVKWDSSDYLRPILDAMNEVNDGKIIDMTKYQSSMINNIHAIRHLACVNHYGKHLNTSWAFANAIHRGEADYPEDGVTWTSASDPRQADGEEVLKGVQKGKDADVMRFAARKLNLLSKTECINTYQMNTVCANNSSSGVDSLNALLYNTLGENMHKMLEVVRKHVVGGDKSGVSPGGAVVANIVDLGVLPINLNALRTSVPLANVLNYSAAYEGIVNDAFAYRDTRVGGRGEIMGGAGEDEGVAQMARIATNRSSRNRIEIGRVAKRVAELEAQVGDATTAAQVEVAVESIVELSSCIDKLEQDLRSVSTAVHKHIDDADMALRDAVQNAVQDVSNNVGDVRQEVADTRQAVADVEAIADDNRTRINDAKLSIVDNKTEIDALTKRMDNLTQVLRRQIAESEALDGAERTRLNRELDESQRIAKLLDKDDLREFNSVKIINPVAPTVKLRYNTDVTMSSTFNRTEIQNIPDIISQMQHIIRTHLHNRVMYTDGSRYRSNGPHVAAPRLTTLLQNEAGLADNRYN
jgi:hypothetical protein